MTESGCMQQSCKLEHNEGLKGSLERDWELCMSGMRMKDYLKRFRINA